MPSRFRLILIPFLITLAVLLIRFVLEVAGIAGASVLNITWLMPIFGVYLSIVCLRQEMGFGRFITTFLLYTLAVRLPVVMVRVLPENHDAHLIERSHPQRVEHFLGRREHRTRCPFTGNEGF